MLEVVAELRGKLDNLEDQVELAVVEKVLLEVHLLQAEHLELMVQLILAVAVAVAELTLFQRLVVMVELRLVVQV